MPKKTAKRRAKKIKRSPRAERRRQVLKLAEHIQAGGEELGAEILRLAHQAMLLIQEEESEQRRDKWAQRLKEAVTPALEDVLARGDRNEKIQAGHLVAKLVDSPGDHLVLGKRFDYGAIVVETLGTLGLGKLQAQVDTGGDQVTSERFLRVLADLEPRIKDACEQYVREALAKK